MLTAQSARPGTLCRNVALAFVTGLLRHAWRFWRRPVSVNAGMVTVEHTHHIAVLRGTVAGDAGTCFQIGGMGMWRKSRIYEWGQWDGDVPP